MIFFLIAFLCGTVSAQTPDAKSGDESASAPTATPAESAAPTTKESTSDYEVDYEEEPAPEEEPVVEKPVVKIPEKKKGGKKVKEVTPQGSRAEKKFAPLMKSETKSVYKKNGRSLDVDTD